MESTIEIELEISENLRNKGFLLIRDDRTIVLEDSDGHQARSYIYQDWNKTTKQFEDKLDNSGIMLDPLDKSEVLSCLSRNYKKLYNGKASSSSTTVGNGDGTAGATETETPLEKLDDMKFEDWQAQQLAKYNTLQETIRNSIMPLPQLTTPLEFALSVKNILNLADCTLPFAGFLLGPPSSLKTLVIELFKAYWRAKYSDDFSPKAWVSHYSGLPPEQLEKIDLLPKIRFKFFLTPELAPLFTGKEDDIRKAFGNLTRILDGKGFETDSGTQGERGYRGNYMFTWLGAVVDVSSRVHRMMGNLGPKMYFLRLNKSYQKEKNLIEQLKNPKFLQDVDKIQKALFDYLKWFEACPMMMESVKEGGIPKMVWDSSKDDIKAIRQIARLALLIGPLRGVVDVDDTENTQGSGYGYTIPIVEEPSRANQQLYNLARGHALTQGRNYITLVDIPLLIKVVLSTAPITRVAVFEMLLANDGTLKAADLMNGLEISRPTVHRAMTELDLLGLVDVKKEGEYDNSPLEMTLKDQYRWCLGSRFRQLREGFSPTRKARKQAQNGKRIPNQGDNVESDSTKCKENQGFVKDNTFSLEFWTIYNTLEDKVTHTVSESSFKSSLIASGKFTAGDATQIIKEAKDKGVLTLLRYDVLSKNSQSNISSFEQK